MNGYPTGYSNQFVDYGTALTNAFNTTVQQRLQDIQNKKVKASENEQMILKALSVESLADMSATRQGKYNEKIKDFRNNMINRFRKTQGQLSLDDKSYIQKTYAKINNEINYDTNWLKQYDEARKFTANPQFQNTIGNVDGYLTDLAQMRQRFDQGEQVESPMSLMVKYHKQPTDAELFMDAAKGLTDNIAFQKTLKVNNDGTVTYTGERTPEAIHNFVKAGIRMSDQLQYKLAAHDDNGQVMRTDTGQIVIDDNKLNDFLGTVTPLLQKKQTEDKLITASEYKAMHGDTGGKKYPPLMPTGATKIGKQDVKEALLLTTPRDTGGLPVKVKDADTGKEYMPSGSKDVRIYQVSVLPDGKPVLNARVSGGWQRNSDGQVMYSPDKTGTIQGVGFTENDLVKNAKQYLSPDAEDARVEDPKIVTNEDGSVTLTGDVVTKDTKGKIRNLLSSGEWKTTSKEVSKTESKTFYPKQDTKGYREVFMPFNEKTMPYVSDKDLNRNIPSLGMTLKQYAESQQGQTAKPQEGKPSESKPTLSVSKYNQTKGTSYTKQQIQDAFGGQYTIVD